MKKNRLYRLCAGLLAGLLVFTGVPQTVSMAEENDLIVSQQPDTEQDLPDTDDTYIEDTFIEDEPDTSQEDDTVVTPYADTVREDSITVQAATPVVQAATDGGGVKIETTGGGWTTDGDVKKFDLERTDASASPISDNKNVKIITATITLPTGATDITRTWSEVSNNQYVTISDQIYENGTASAKITASSDPNHVGQTATVKFTVTARIPDTIDEDGHVTSYRDETFSDTCQVRITPLLVRKIEVPDLAGGSVELKANDTPKKYPVKFTPAGADNITTEFGTVVAPSSDDTHVTANLIRNSTDDGYELELAATTLGLAIVRVQARNPLNHSDIVESESITVQVNEYVPVEVTRVYLAEAAGNSFAEITDTIEMYENSDKRVRVYFEPNNTTQKNVALISEDNMLLSVTQGTGTGENWIEYTLRARTLTSSDTVGADNCVATTITLKSNDKESLTKQYQIKIKKETHAVENIRADRTTLELKDRGEGSVGTFRVFLEPNNADYNRILLTSDNAIFVRKSGEGEYTQIGGSNPAFSLEATASDGRLVCTFDVKANPGEAGTYRITAASNDPAYQGTVTVEVNVTHHKITDITLSPSTLTLYEAPETDYQPADLGEIEATIDPVESHIRKIKWEISPAAGTSDTVARIVDEANDDLVTMMETEADEMTGKTAVKIIGLKRGECVVTAKSVETETVVARCTVRVTTGRYSVASIDLLDEQGHVIDLDTIVMRPNKTLNLQARVNPQTAINADLTVSRSDTALQVSRGETADGITPVHIMAESQENGEGSTVTVRAGGREKAIKVQIKNPYMEFGQRELHYAPDEVNEAAIRHDLTVRFYKILDLDPASYELVTDYDLTLITASGVHLTTENVNWAEELSRPGEKTLHVKYTYTENDTDQTFEKDLTLVVSQYPLVDLVRVINPDKVWNVPNGTSLNSMILPTKVDITVRDRNADSSEDDRRMRADVTWNRSSNRYDPNSKEEQNFTLNGTVTLPEGVRNPSGASLDVRVEVNVREAMSAGRKVQKPVISVQNGAIIPAGTKITLTCETEGASIYYTLDGTEATRNGLLYTAPIQPIAATTVLRAMAYKEGWQDSDPVKIVLYLDASANADLTDPDDPDAPIPDDVTPEDKEQIGGKTDGLWAVIQDAEGREEKLPVFAYNGNAHKPAVHVYDGTRLLKEKTDYTVSYKNNKNAGGPGTTDKYPAVIITGKGNYEGKIEVPFIIKPVDINDDSVMMDDTVAVAYNKKAQKPTPKLTWNGKKLASKKDFNYDDKASYKEPGVYMIQVTGVGNYTGARILKYEIYENGVSASKFTVSKVTDQKYTGNRITPAVTVTYNKVTLTAGVNYEIKYENNLNVGTASVVIIGQGGYKGSKRINFKILPIADMKNVAAVLTFEPAAPVYDGKAVKPASYTLTYQSKKLREGEDYTVSYLNNDKAGTATVVFTGKGPFKGTLKKNFRIEKGSILKASIEMNVSYPYEKGGCKPKPRVILGDRVLVEGTDYSLSYKNNNKIGNTAQVTVKGKGNYAGSLPKFYAVTMQNIGNLRVEASDVVYKPKKNSYKTKVRVYDLNGKKLEAGKDYAEDIIYTYASGPKKDQPVLSTDIVPAGTRIQVEVRVTKPKLYVGTAYAVYRIVEADITNAKVKVLDQEYTGRKVRPNKSQIVSITVKNVPLMDNDYEITGYQNNINQGTAKMTIRGIGNYGGTKEVTFKIKKKGILGLRY